MADTAPAVKPAKKKVSKPKKPADHPKYSEMIKAAVSALKQRSGSSRQAITKYIRENFKVDSENAGVHVKMALKRGVASGALKQVKGTGASGSFKLGEKEQTKKAVKPKTAAAKKPKAKKPKAAKKTGEKKAAAKKPKAKKPAAKKAAKPKKTKSPKKPKTAKPKTKKSPKKKAATKKA